MSWLAIDDIAPIIHHLYENNLAGPVNFVSPNPVRNEEFTKVLAEVLNRPALLNLSEANLRLLLGEIADEMILSSAKVIPKVLLDSGYKFKYPFLKEALIAQTS
jgi:NAD dependent epimerase/dehydratase family enzyme